MLGQTAFLAEPTLDVLEYTVTVPLHQRQQREFTVPIRKFNPSLLHEGDNPLLELVAGRLQESGVRVLMCVRLYKIILTLEARHMPHTYDQIGQIKTVMEGIFNLCELHEPVHSLA